MRAVLVSILFLFLTSGCSLFILESNLDPDEYLPEKLLIVVDEAIEAETRSSVDLYMKDLTADGISSELIIWETDRSSFDLKDTINSYSTAIDGAFFIGEIPPAWFEQTAFGKKEVFPSDIYYMDVDAVWTDSDGNGYFESHSDLEIELYISRLPGTSSEINSYLSKLHDYRTSSSKTPVYDGAFIFKDDDWYNNYRNNDFGLKLIYSNVSFYQDDENTTKSSYIERMTNSGSEYVYQWIHAQPSALFIDVGDNYEIFKTDDISLNNVKGNFYNLFDCQAARFTVRNLAQNYLVNTDSCIAVLGSTKTGGVYYPVEFHKSLGLGACWGAAYKSWYNTEGYTDDMWFLGMIIMGDPAIRPQNASGADMTGGSRSVSNLVPISSEEKEEMFLKLQNFEPLE